MTHELFNILRKLEAKHLWFQIYRLRDDSVTIHVTAVVLRLEIDVFENGNIEYSRFIGDESVESDREQLDRLIAEFGDE